MPNDHSQSWPVRQMLDTICTLPLTSDVFTQSIHPAIPVIALGLASGHVQIHRLPPCRAISDNIKPTAGQDTIENIWGTHRHKRSCRSLSFSPDGSFLFSAGTNGIVKAAATETGRVVSKIAVPGHSQNVDAPTLVHALSPQCLLVATDSSALHIYDLRSSAIFTSRLPQKTYNPHDDYISSLSPLAPSETSTSGFSKQWISTGGSSIVTTDLRKGVIKTEDLGEELFSSIVLKNGKVIVGGERGILKILETGKWQESKKIVVEKGESLDVLGTNHKGIDSETNDRVAVGMGDGTVRIVSIQGRKVIGKLRHDEIEGVTGLGFEPGGRMITSGGSVLKVWQENSNGEEEEEEDEEVEERREDNANDEDVKVSLSNGNNEIEDHEEDEDGSEVDKSNDSSEEEENRRKRKKRKKRGRFGSASAGTEKGIFSFKGLD